MTEEELSFDKREIPEIKKIQQEQKIEIRQKRDYGNKYMEDKTTVSIARSLFGKLEKIQTKRGFKTKGELLEYLVEIDEVYDPKLETIYECKRCHEKVDANKDMNLDRLVHKDLCKNNQCGGSIISKQKIVKEMLSGATGKKLEQSEITEAKSKLSELSRKKEHIPESVPLLDWES